jgi:GNAT superfamily N-acetyltransferase
MRETITVTCPVNETFRVAQVAGMFDLDLDQKATATFDVDVPLAADPVEGQPWQIGCIVGPSGSGKSTVARHAYGKAFYEGGKSWPKDKAVIDGFGEVDIREITHALTAVGFSSPPSWIKPYHVLSNGERFRCDLARALLTGGKLVAYDEFTSVVDRTVAKIGSAAASKAIRKGKINRQFVAVTCHYDIVEWLEPDWVLDMATCQLARSSLRRPRIRLEIAPVHRSAWSLFRRHHYLSTSISVGSKSFVAFWGDEPVAFCSWVHRMTRNRRATDRREHRTVVLPDYQGLGIGNRVSEFCASIVRGIGGRAFSTTSHPAMIRYRSASPLWKRQRLGIAMPKGATGIMTNYTAAVNRITAGFEFVGPALDSAQAAALWNAVPGEFEPKATRLAVLAIIQAHPGATRTLIARRLNLSTSAVARLCEELIARSEIIAQGSGRGSDRYGYVSAEFARQGVGSDVKTRDSVKKPKKIPSA